MPVEQLRTILLISLIAVTFLLWQAWMVDYGPKPTPVAERAPSTSTDGAPSDAAASDPAPSVPVPLASEDGPTAAPVEAVAADSPASITQQSGIGDGLVVETDTLRAEIEPRGGALVRVELLGYPESTDRPDQPFVLLERGEQNLFIAQSGLLGGTETTPAPDHHAEFVPEAMRVELADGADEVQARLVWRAESGITVTKVFTFRRDSYVVAVDYEIENPTDAPWPVRMFGQLQRSQVIEPGGLFRTYTYTGGILSHAEKPYDKVDFDDMSKRDVDLTVRGGWLAIIQHYFAGAWIPDAEHENRFYSRSIEGATRFVLGVIGAPVQADPGARAKVGMRLFVGPKVQSRMAAVTENLQRTVDYGWLWLIAQPLFWLLDGIHGIVGNWGWSIILLTLIIKLLFFHLSAASYKSMARMRKLQPRLTQLRERYGDDRARLNQAMMELYKEEKINPLGGCLPILVQIPVFIALYWVLLESVELRQAPFILWIEDLSVRDPYFVLPIAMGVTMILQQRLNPAPPDPIQAKVMMALPFVFTILFLNFPAGLVLYWFVNNCLSIAQQWIITRKIVGPTT